MSEPGRPTEGCESLVFALSPEDHTPEEAAGLLAEVARVMNIPARIVRGYNASESGEVEDRMHAWTELYLPGTGWRGYDATRGTRVDGTYLPVAVGKTNLLTQVVEGRQRGNFCSPQTTTEIYLRQQVELPSGLASEVAGRHR